MDSLKEKRINDRLACEVSITCSLFHGKLRHTATAIDFGAEGMRVVSNIAYSPGTPISTRIDNWRQSIPESKNDVKMRAYGIGEVMWCREIATQAGSRYEMGVRYFSTD